ncbi:MAG: hypothetical protein PHC62_09630 [Candidatus Izemoplasmatales bacterium]|nr:hypothetical protein [Candidatus Izemoplasmatales bacterium]
MISKKLFCDTLARMEVLQRVEDQVNLVFEENAVKDMLFSYGDVFVLLLEVLTETMHDEERGWITYFIFDLNYGKEYGTDRRLTPIDEDGNFVPASNSEELYQYLVEKATDKGFI